GAASPAAAAAWAASPLSVWRATRSVKLTRAFLKPVVLTLARLLAMASTLCCWACMPVAAIWRASNMAVAWSEMKIRGSCLGRSGVAQLADGGAEHLVAALGHAQQRLEVAHAGGEAHHLLRVVDIGVLDEALAHGDLAAGQLTHRAVGGEEATAERTQRRLAGVHEAELGDLALAVEHLAAGIDGRGAAGQRDLAAEAEKRMPLGGGEAAARID